MKKKPKKHKPSKEEITNDPSLRWHAYQFGETVWSDVHNKQVRFLRRDKNDKIVVGDLVLRELPEKLEPIEVRRKVTEHQESAEERRKILRNSLENRE